MEFSSTLISSLESTPETNYTRQQFSAQFIEKEVNKRLKELQTSKLNQLDSKLTEALLPAKDDDGKSVASVNEKLTEINKRLKQINESKPSKNQELLKAEKAVASCLSKNRKEVLNCWDEVEAIKKLANIAY